MVKYPSQGSHTTLECCHMVAGDQVGVSTDYGSAPFAQSLEYTVCSHCSSLLHYSHAESLHRDHPTLLHRAAHALSAVSLASSPGTQTAANAKIQEVWGLMREEIDYTCKEIRSIAGIFAGSTKSLW